MWVCCCLNKGQFSFPQVCFKSAFWVLFPFNNDKKKLQLAPPVYSQALIMRRKWKIQLPERFYSKWFLSVQRAGCTKWLIQSLKSHLLLLTSTVSHTFALFDLLLHHHENTQTAVYFCLKVNCKIQFNLLLKIAKNNAVLFEFDKVHSANIDLPEK